MLPVCAGAGASSAALLAPAHTASISSASWYVWLMGGQGTLMVDCLPRGAYGAPLGQIQTH